MAYDSTFSAQVQTFSLTNGGTAELMLSADQSRQHLTVQQQTEVGIIQFGGTAGTQATGTLTFGANATDTETIAVNGITFTFVAGASTATNVHIGASKEATAAEFIVVLNASANAAISVATYTLAGAIVTVTYDMGGLDGNAFTLADSSGAHVTRSGATLTGGSNTVGGFSLASLGVPYTFNAEQHPSIKNEVYILSATNAAKTAYLVGAN